MSAQSGAQVSTTVDFTVVYGMVVANGWATQAQIEPLSATITERKQLIRALVDQRIMAPDTAGQLDLLLQQQAHLPNFRLIKKLGAGGMGTVYLAEHRASGEQVALKVISARLIGDSEFLNRFHRETKALVGLRHPHLANIIESGTQGETHYLAMENVSGPSLGEMLKEYRALPEHYVLGLIHQLADCLNYVYHKAGLVHRDIKPENVLVSRVANAQELFPEGDQAKLIDFGLVKTANDDEHLTQTGMTIGTPLYMSPEQVRGEKLDCRSDIYGLGATTFHLLTGMPPFRGTSPGAIMSAHLTQPVPDPGTLVPGLSASVRRLVMTAMAKGVNERYITFDAFLKACDACLDQAREKHGGSIKLLRKPLVIARKPAVVGHESGHRESVGQTAAAKKSLSERIQRKHDEKKAGVDVSLPDLSSVAQHQHSAVRPAASPTPPPRNTGSSSVRIQPTVERPAGGSATAALVRAHTDKIRAKKTLPKPPPAPAPDLSRSAVFAEDPKATAGTGLIPWLILGFAVVIAIAYGVWRTMGP